MGQNRLTAKQAIIAVIIGFGWPLAATATAAIIQALGASG